MRMYWLHKRTLVIGLVVLSALSRTALAGEMDALTEDVRKLAAAPGVAKMHVGIRIVALGPDRTEVFSQNADQPFKPASNQKIVTTGATLTMLPGDFKYRTILGQRGNDLVIIGAGDPSIGDLKLAQAANEPVTAVFEKWADQLKQQGVTSIPGNLLFDDSIFDSEFIPPDWRKEQNVEDWYVAPVGGLIFNDNCVSVVLTPGEKGKPAMVTLTPDWVKLDNKSVSGGKGQPIVRRASIAPLTIAVSKNVSRPTGSEDPTSVPVDDPGVFFAETCRSVLTAKGIKIEGKVHRQRVRNADGTLPADLKPLATHERKPIDFLWRLNKSSMNLFGEALFKTIGAYGPGDKIGVGTRQSGAAAVRRFLDKIGSKAEGCVFDDGSGLSHVNRVTPTVLSDVLVYMDRQATRKQWWSSLGTPGDSRSITLRHRMATLRGSVYAKTGYISGASALSGYVVAVDRKRYFAFSILCNDIEKAKGGSGAAHKLQDDICAKLAAFKPAAPPAAAAPAHK
jgi:serine-type D-Ala-D-Ala carboxypeptidase/endopeptidase (penicillin-binding protein 4)